MSISMKPVVLLPQSSPQALRSAEEDWPRERLVMQGASVLSDAELLALLLRTGAKHKDVMDVARGVLQSLGGLDGLLRATDRELCALDGVGPAKSATLQAALELGKRVASRRLRPGASIRSASDVFAHYYPQLRTLAHERFLILVLDGRHRILKEVTVSQGTLTASLVHPREVFRAALRETAAAIILVHNHPSGDPSPSAEDREITLRLVSAGEILGIKVLDHLVIGEQGFVSFLEAGLMATKSGWSGA